MAKRCFREPQTGLVERLHLKEHYFPATKYSLSWCLSCASCQFLDVASSGHRVKCVNEVKE